MNQPKRKNQAPKSPKLEWDWKSGPCQHIGETIRNVPCKPCQGRKEAEVKACELHGECSWSHGLRSEGESGKLLKSCRHCGDYQSTEVCAHRGEELRIIETRPHCPQCPPGTVRVLACELHGECTEESQGVRSLDGRRLLKACDKCEDSTIKPPTPSPSPSPSPKPEKPKPKPKGFEKTPPITGFLRTGLGRPADHLQDIYHGASAFLLLSGPSLATMPLDQLNQVGVVVAACNNAATLCRPQLWFMVDSPGNFNDALWRDPAVAKLANVDRANVNLRTHKNGQVTKTSLPARECPCTYFYSLSSGFTAENFLDRPKPAWECELYDGKKKHKKRSVMLVAIRMLYWLGFRTVYLVGADFHYRPEKTYAFEGCDKVAAACGTNNTTMGVLNEWFQRLRPEFERRGFWIYNCTPQSRLSAFDSVDFGTAIDRVAWQGPLLTEGLYGG